MTIIYYSSAGTDAPVLNGLSDSLDAVSLWWTKLYADSVRVAIQYAGTF
jgi:hypothetical protein